MNELEKQCYEMYKKGVSNETLASMLGIKPESVSAWMYYRGYRDDPVDESADQHADEIERLFRNGVEPRYMRGIVPLDVRSIRHVFKKFDIEGKVKCEVWTRYKSGEPIKILADEFNRTPNTVYGWVSEVNSRKHKPKKKKCRLVRKQPRSLTRAAGTDELAAAVVWQAVSDYERLLWGGRYKKEITAEIEELENFFLYSEWFKLYTEIEGKQIIRYYRKAYEYEEIE